MFLFIDWLLCLAVGFVSAYLFYHWENYHHVREKVYKALARRVGIFRDREEPIWVRAYRALSWRKESRLIGYIATAKIPVLLRRPIFSLYIKYFSVDMEDVEEQDLTKYRSLNEFFSRPLKVGVRPIAATPLVSPADCHVYHFGKIVDYEIKHVKGYTYTLDAYFGEDVAKQIRTAVEKKENQCLWYCVCYLSPSDYHRFHSPADLTLLFRRHFSGRLLSVSEKIVNIVPDIFDINERVLVTGEWEYGFFSLTAVGATNVGSIQMDFDERRTNLRLDAVGSHDDLIYQLPVKKTKGDAFGRFHFGSTLVLVFQAPCDFKFLVTKGDKLVVGQPLADLDFKSKN